MSTTRSDDEVLEAIRSLDPYDFEKFIADVWQERQGWSTKVTKEAADGGVDVFGRPPGSDGWGTALQAKLNSPSNPVSSSKVQQYASLREQYELVAEVTIVTTGAFTRPALETAEDLGVRCINGEELVEIIRRSDAWDVLEWYLDGKPGG